MAENTEKYLNKKIIHLKPLKAQINKTSTNPSPNKDLNNLKKSSTKIYLPLSIQGYRLQFNLMIGFGYSPFVEYPINALITIFSLIELNIS